jgi:hypothetical protein
MLWSLWRKKPASTSNCSTSCASTSSLTPFRCACRGLHQLSGNGGDDAVQGARHHVFLEGALREPGLSLLVVELGVAATTVHARPRQQAHELYAASLPALDCVHAQRLVVSEAGHRHPAPGQQ